MTNDQCQMTKECQNENPNWHLDLEFSLII